MTIPDRACARPTAGSTQGRSVPLPSAPGPEHAETASSGREARAVTEIKPSCIRVEAATVCQLRCPLCSTTVGKTARHLGSGFLRFDAFKRLIDDNPWVADVELSNWGEIFLNPDLLPIIRYAYERDVTLRADNGVNLNTVDETMLEALVACRFRSMTCSIDGASQATYAIYRKQGNFEQVIEHIRRINAHKTRYRSVFPLLRWQFVAFGHNEHEISAARRLANALGMRFYVKLSWSDKFSPMKDAAQLRRETGLNVASEQEFKVRYGRRYMGSQICGQLWRRPQLNFDGRVLGCCVNFWGDFGNAFKEGLGESLNNEKIAYARQMLQGKTPSREDIPCTTCSYYQRMKESHAWLQAGEVKALRAPSRFHNRILNRFISPSCARLLVKLRLIR